MRQHRVRHEWHDPGEAFFADPVSTGIIGVGIILASVLTTPERPMLSLILMTVLSTASAQDEFADVAAPEPEGCWGDAASPFPAQDATNVPVDTSPRFFLDGRCAGAVDIVMVDVDDTVIDVVLDEQEHEWSTTIIVDPVAELSPSTAYTMTITTEFGQPSELRFTTGEAVSEPRPDLEVLGVMADGWCSGQEQADFGLSIEVGSDQEGLVGYAGASSTSAFGWSPILVQNGRANLWVNTTAQLGATEACASIARLEDDGSLGEWQEVCAPTPDLGDCRERRQFLGCGGGGRPVRGGDPVPLAAFLFLPLVGLLGRRRRR